MKIDNTLLAASTKLIALQSIPEWENELLSKAPPVLWFGNSKSGKPKILTVGANPSRREFLEKSFSDKSVKKEIYETKYLLKKRFYHLSGNQSYKDIVQSKQLRDSIINSFDNYFETEPYTIWFGKNDANPYKVEAVLRGMQASYYNNPKDFNSKYQACHIDIFPFATISDFNKIKNITERDVLCNNWAKELVDELITYFNPEKILVFGSTNFHYFSEYFGIDNKPTDKSNCTIWNKIYKGCQLIGVSPNLGNPRNFDKQKLLELGKTLNNLPKK